MARSLVLRWLVLFVVAVALAALHPAATAVAEPAPPDTVATSENEFLPVEQDLTECTSALPPPNCGSEARGGWRQMIVMVVVGVGLAFIGWRIVRALRAKGDAWTPTSSESADTS